MRTVSIIASAAVCLSIGCGGSTEPTVPNIVDTYNLATVNGSGLPATINVNGFIETFTSGTLSVAASSYQFSICIRSTGAVSSCGTDFENLFGSGQWFDTSNGLIFIDSSDKITRPATFASGHLMVPYGLNNVLTFNFSKQ